MQYLNLFILYHIIRLMDKQILIYIHGYRSKSKIFSRLNNKINKESILFDYDLDNEKVEDIEKRLFELCKKNKHNKISFVCHSLGGLVLNYMLNKRRIDVDKIILISTPINSQLEKINFHGKEKLLISKEKLIKVKELFIINSYILDKKSSYSKFEIDELDILNDGVLSLKETYVENKDIYTFRKLDHFWILFNKEVINKINQLI